MGRLGAALVALDQILKSEIHLVAVSSSCWMIRSKYAITAQLVDFGLRTQKVKEKHTSISALLIIVCLHDV